MSTKQTSRLSRLYWNLLSVHGERETALVEGPDKVSEKPITTVQRDTFRGSTRTVLKDPHGETWH